MTKLTHGEDGKHIHPKVDPMTTDDKGRYDRTMKCNFRYCKDCSGYHNYCRCNLYQTVPNYCPDCGRETREVKTHDEFWGNTIKAR